MALALEPVLHDTAYGFGLFHRAGVTAVFQEVGCRLRDVVGDAQPEAIDLVGGNLPVITEAFDRVVDPGEFGPSLGDLDVRVGDPRAQVLLYPAPPQFLIRGAG